jgi:phage shock protein A
MANNTHETQRIVGLLFQARIESDALNEVAKVLENKDKKIEALENHIARVTNTDNLLKVYKSVQKVQNEVKDLWGEGEVSKLLRRSNGRIP